MNPKKQLLKAGNNEVFILSAVLVSLASSCHIKNVATSKTPPPEVKPINRKIGQYRAATFYDNGIETTVVLSGIDGSTKYIGKYESDRYVYRAKHNGSTEAEVQGDTNGILMVSFPEKLTWRVRIEGNKVTIVGPDFRGLPAEYHLTKMKGGSVSGYWYLPSLKLRYNLGKVVHNANTGATKVIRDNNELEASGYTGGFLILNNEGLGYEYLAPRAIIVAEMIKRGW